MWIHLVTLGLIDGAGGGVVPEPTDTHDGWWAKQWLKKKKKPEEPLEQQIEELVEEVIEKAKKPSFKPPVALPSTALQRAELIERILVQLIDDEEELEIEMLML